MLLYDGLATIYDVLLFDLTAPMKNLGPVHRWIQHRSRSG